MSKLLQQMSENLSFIGVCAVIVALIWGGAKLAQRWLPKMHKVSPARRITLVAVCAAIATVLHMLDFPLLFLAPSFYKLDFSELPVLLCGFYLGPAAAVTCEALKIVLKLLFKGTSTAFVGDFANFAVGCALVLPAVIIYHVRKTKKAAIIGLVVGSACLTVFGSAFNAIYLLPKFSQLYGLPLESIIAMGSGINPAISNLSTFVLLAVAPLNIVKGVAVSVLTMLLYKKVAKPLFQIHR